MPVYPLPSDVDLSGLNNPDITGVFDLGMAEYLRRQAQKLNEIPEPVSEANDDSHAQ